ncbi:MAG: 2-amino-4-hydroxy-6-hydroxymethyldihydropteridine diphosphokinase [Vicinamibacteria bacterium]
MASPDVYLALGSNLGDREATLDGACRALAERGFAIARCSALYLTEPVGGPPQGWYVNQVVGGETALAPEALLDTCLAVEREFLRERRERNGPRTLDVDLLLWGETLIDGPRLTLPHPRLHERRFVLVPLAEIAPELRHPRLGLSVAELLARCPDTSEVRLHAQAGSPR